MKNTISRRGFLGGAMAATLAGQATAGGKLPTRVFGRTGIRVPILALGGGSRMTSYGEKGAVEAINLAIDQGITYLDTARSYGKGEIWTGMVMKHRRNEVFLSTKLAKESTADQALRQMDESLRRLQTDHLDVVHIHGLSDEADLARFDSGDSVLQALYKLREQKVTRCVGISCHTNPIVLKKAIERYDLDCVIMALNAGLQGMTNGRGKMVIDPSVSVSFEKVALPAAKKKNLGVIAMKVTGQEDLLGGATQYSMDDLLRYSLSLPVAAAVVGMPKLDQIRHNAEFARNFKPMPPAQMRDLSDRVSRTHKLALDRRFAHHIDA